MAKKVTIYSTPSCSFCHMAKEFLKEKNIDFEDIDVAADQDKGREMVAKTGQMGVPVIIIKNEDDGEEKIIVGFDVAGLSEALDIKE